MNNTEYAWVFEPILLKIQYDNSWLKQLNFKGHDDQDLSGNVDAVSIKSNDGNIHSFYKNKPVEHPYDFRFTKYYKMKLKFRYGIRTTKIIYKKYYE